MIDQTISQSYWPSHGLLIDIQQLG